ncbi:hypothetical protein [Sulfurimonas sp. HSL-1716]|uniref:hypothetical protein n=1 Tax=Hydrocurvibacter sulfurireducens TaxID=3131937 RepID=UPI0031FA08AE
MKAYSIDPADKSIKIQEFDGQVNSIYTFFNSILVDSSHILNDHIIYTDGNALSTTHTPFFIGQQLFLGKALIIGQNGLEEVDVKIQENELEKLIDYNINDFYKKALDSLALQDINLYKTFEVDDNGSKLSLNYEWVIYTFNMADVKTQNYFLIELDKIIDGSKSIEDYFQKMAQLAVNAGNR